MLFSYLRAGEDGRNQLTNFCVLDIKPLGSAFFHAELEANVLTRMGAVSAKNFVDTVGDHSVRRLLGVRHH